MAISARAVRCDCTVLLTCCAPQPMTDTLSSGLRPKPRPKPKPLPQTQPDESDVLRPEAQDDGGDIRDGGDITDGNGGHIHQRCPQTSRCIVPEDLIIINGNGGDITDGIIIARCSRVSRVQCSGTRQ